MIFKALNLVRTSYFSGNLEEEKKTRIALEFIFLVSQKFVIYKILNTLTLFWFIIDSSVLNNEGVHFFFDDICHFFIYIADCIKIYKRIL